MTLPNIEEVTSEDEARQIAIDYQGLTSVGSLSYSELAEYSEYFRTLAAKFSLEDEFSENGVI